MNPIKVSICISTRNRGAFIGETLESIVSQASDEVEIVVLDGASTDNTQEIVEAYRDRFPALRYFRRETNMGLDRDFTNAVDLARGDYCWLFTDDDLLKPGALRTVLEALKNEYSLVIANSEVWNADLSKLLEARRVPIRANRIYKSNENDLLLADTGQYLSFIGGIIIQRRLWSARDKASYFGSYFVHLGVVFQQPLPGDTLVIAEPLVAIRYGNASWLGRSFEIWMFKWPDLVWSFPHLPDSAKRRVCPREPWRPPWTLLRYRARKAYSKREYAELLKPRLTSFRARAVSKACAYFPGRIANLLAFVYLALVCRRRSSRLLTALDLENSPFCFWKLPMRSALTFKERPVVISNVGRLPSSTSTADRKDKPAEI
jgi:glycosyltransferase involved in cell wall biosynthesis